MGVLNRKLRRDLLGNPGMLITVVAIIAVGTGLYIGMASSQRILQSSQQAYYAQYNFADFWIDVKKAPLTVVEPLAEIDGVAQIRSRVVFDVVLDLPSVEQPLTGRLISVPRTGLADALNGLYLAGGPGFSDDRDQEVILAQPFAEAHGLTSGDRIEMILNRKRESFVVVGTALSPEYVYMVSGEGSIVPDPKHFGVLFVKEDFARDVLGFQDACNQIVGRLAPGAIDRVEVLLQDMTRRLEPYGVFSATPRSRQASNRFLSDEIKGLGVTAAVLPALFLLVAALVLNVVMSRMAERQRTIIGTLKAMGYSSRSVLMHYLAFGTVIGVLGAVGGAVLGVVLAKWLIQLYHDYFQFPTYLTRTYPDLLGHSLAFGLVCSLAGTAKGVWKVLKLHPAEAMRPRPPQVTRRLPLERWRWLWERFGFRTHMAVRTVFRNPGRSISGIVSAALAGAIVLVTLVLYDSMGHMVRFHFDRARHSDVDLALRDETGAAVLDEALALPGVDYAEPSLAVVCHLRHGPAWRRVAVTGLPPTHRLVTPIDPRGRPIDIPPVGLAMSSKLAELMNVTVGDALELTPVRGRRETHHVPVTRITEGFLGLECYADIGYLSRLTDGELTINSIQMKVDGTRASELNRRIKELPNVAAMSAAQDARASIEGTFVRSMAATLGLTIIFAGILGFGSILNAMLIEIEDRRREVGTFAVMGYRPRQIAGIFFRESTMVFVSGLLLSVPLSWLLVRQIAGAYDTELYRMPVVFRAPTVLTGLTISLGFLLTAQAVVYQQIRKLDWLEAIKLRE